MSEQIKNGERQKRIAELVTLLEARIDDYPHTWHAHQDLQPYLREYVMLTKDTAYQSKLEAQEAKYK